jgi:hypothetical protein
MILIIAFFFINVVVYNKFLQSKDLILTEFKKLTGFSLSYKNMSPNIVSSIKVNEVKLVDENGTEINLGDIDLSYSFLSYLRNKENPISFITKISLKTLNLNTNMVDLQNKIKIFKEKLTSINKNKNASSIKINNLTIEFKKCNFYVSDGERNYSFFLDNLQANVSDEIKIKSKINSNINISKNLNMKFQLNTEGIIYNLENQDTIFDIEFNAIEINSMKFKKQKFSFSSRYDDFKFERTSDLLPIKFVIEKKDHNIGSFIVLDNLMSRDIVISADKNNLNVQKIDLNDDLTYNIETKMFNGNISFKLPIDELYFFKNIEINSDLKFKDNLIVINDLSIKDEDKNDIISLKGEYPLYRSDFGLNLKMKDLKFASTTLNADFFINKKKNDLNIYSDYFLLNGIDIGQLSLNVQDQDRKYHIMTMKDFNGYSFSGDVYNNKDHLVILMRHNFNNFNVKPFINAYYKDFKDDYFINGSFNSDIDKNGVTIPQSEITVNDKEKKLADFKIDLKDKVFHIADFEIPEKNISSEAVINFIKQPFSLNATVKKDSFVYDISSNISRDRISLAINNELEAIYNPVEKYLYVNARDFILPYKELKLNCSFIYDLNSKRIFENYLTLNNLGIFPGETGVINSKMSYENDILKLYDFIYADKTNRITGMIESQIGLSGMFGLNINGFLKDDQKGESYSINTKIKGSNIDGKFQISHMDVKKIFKDNMKGFLNLRFSLNGDINNPDIDLDGELTEGKLSTSDLKGVFSIKKVDNKLLLKKINLQLSKNRIFVSNSDISFGKDDSAKINILGNINLNGLSKILKTDFYVKGLYSRISGNNTSIFSSLIQQLGIYSTGDTTTNPINLDIGFDNINLFYLKDINIVRQEKINNIKFNLNRDNNLLVFKNYGEKFVYFTSSNNVTSLKFYNNDNTVFNADINTAGGLLKGNVKFSRFPVNSIEKIIIPYVDIQEGLIDGQIELKGKSNSPEFYGKLFVYNGVLGVPDYLLDTVQNISGVIVADKNKIHVNNVNGNVRSGKAHGYGEIVFNGWNFENYTFHVNSESVPAYVKIGPVDARGMANIEDFTFDGGKEQNFNFIATFGVSEAEVNLASLMGLDSTGNTKLPVLPINVIINFKAGDKVKVNYPIIKGYVKKGDVFTLKYIGLEPNIYLGGLVNMNKGDIYYFNKTFKIEQSTFKFDENDPRINPLVNIKSYYRTRDSRGEQVKIILNLNERLLSFKSSLTSLPYKTQDEINGLIGVSIATTNETDINKNTVSNTTTAVSENNPQNIDSIINATNYISNAFLFSPIENNIRRVTTLDTFSLNTSFFGNIIKQNSNFLDLMDNTNLSIGKYVSNEIYLGSIMSFNKKNASSGSFFYTFPDNNYGLNLQLMLQVELPYISFGYSYVPKDEFKSGDHVISMEFSFKF